MKKETSNQQQQMQQTQEADQTPQPDFESGQAKSDFSREEIARRAHAIYEQRGGFPGAELDDWLQAERELREQAGDQTDKAA